MIAQPDRPIYFDWVEADVLGFFLAANYNNFLKEAEMCGFEKDEAHQMYKDILRKINRRIAE